ATPADRGAANINYERKPLAVPGTWNPGTNYADSRYQLPQIDTINFQSCGLLKAEDLNGFGIPLGLLGDTSFCWAAEGSELSAGIGSINGCFTVAGGCSPKAILLCDGCLLCDGGKIE
ncbi:hypothetical protein ACL1IJ_05445, partial [Corynebacterium striatum]